MCFPGSATHGEEERRAGGEMGSAEVVFVRSCTGPSVVAPADSVTAFTHSADSRASPRQEGGDPLTSDGCLNIIPPEQAEEEEMKGFRRKGTAQLPAFPADHHEEGLALEVALSAGRALDQEHLTYLFWVVLLPTGPDLLAGRAAPGSSPAVGTQQRSFKESFFSFLFIH